MVDKKRVSDCKKGKGKTKGGYIKMLAKIELTDDLKSLEIVCPYCEQKSSFTSWNFYVEPVIEIKNNGLNLEKHYVYSDAECPVCGSFIELRKKVRRKKEKIKSNNIKEIKKVIEAYPVDVTKKLIYCPFCMEWNNFYNWRLKGYAEKLNVTIINNDEVSVNGDIQKVFIIKAICKGCGFKIELDYIKVTLPILKNDIKLLISKIKEAIKKNN